MDAFVGEIRAFAFSYIPQGWLACQGQIVSVQQYQALGALLGTTYGGNAQNGTFALPDLQGKAWIGNGTGPGLTPRAMTKSYGSTSEVLDGYSYLGPHNHTVNVMVPTGGSNIQANALTTPVANSSWLSQLGDIKDATHYKYAKPYLPAASATTNTTLAAATIGSACGTPMGGVASHGNIQPYLTLIMCICWEGTFPEYN